MAGKSCAYRRTNCVNEKRSPRLCLYLNEGLYLLKSRLLQCAVVNSRQCTSCNSLVLRVEKRVCDTKRFEILCVTEDLVHLLLHHLKSKRKKMSLVCYFLTSVVSWMAEDNRELDCATTICSHAAQTLLQVYKETMMSLHVIAHESLLPSIEQPLQRYTYWRREISVEQRHSLRAVCSDTTQ